MNKALLACALSGLLAACATEQTTPVMPVQHYSCGEWVVLLDPNSQASMLNLKDKRIALHQAPAASGVLYRANEGTWVHEKGGEIVASYDGQELPDCQPLLTSREWLVEDIDGGGIIDRSHATLTFSEDGKLSGSASCNRYFGEYQRQGEALSFMPLGTTLMACPESLMNQEQRFLKALQAADRFSIDVNGALILEGQGHRILAR